MVVTELIPRFTSDVSWTLSDKWQKGGEEEGVVCGLISLEDVEYGMRIGG